MATKSKERRAFERRLARLYRALDRTVGDAYGLVGEARDLGLEDYQVGATMMAVEALLKARSRVAGVQRDMEERAVTDAEPELPAQEQPLALAKYVPGQGYVLNGRVVG
jgi:hypothetical protein